MRVSKPVIRQGNALAVALTRELKSLGYSQGDWIELEIIEKEDGDMESKED